MVKDYRRILKSKNIIMIRVFQTFLDKRNIESIVEKLVNADNKLSPCITKFSKIKTKRQITANTNKEIIHLAFVGHLVALTVGSSILISSTMFVGD